MGLDGKEIERLAKLVGCHRRTLEMWRRQGAPMPQVGEADEAWIPRLRTWNETLPRRTGRVFGQKTSNWEERSRRALAQNREHDLAVKKGQYVPRALVVTEWSKLCFAVRTGLLGLPRAIAGAVTAPPEVRAQIEGEGTRLVHGLLADFVRIGELTPTPPDIQEQKQ